MKGIVLAGGTGSRLWPVTKVTSKQLLPVYDKPMIFYPISTLMLAGAREILIITTPHDQPAFQELLGNGHSLGVNFQYAIQAEPKGLAQAFTIGSDFLNGDSCLMILGDNIFHGAGLGKEISKSIPEKGAHVFTYPVADPSQYGVLTLDDYGNPVSIIEKPITTTSNLAVTGLYFVDQYASKFAEGINPSPRGELEITSLLGKYLDFGNLTYTHLNRGVAWLDTGNPNSLQDAANYVKIIEDRTGQKIACLEEIAWRNGWISDVQLEAAAQNYGSSSYGKYILSLLHGFESKKIENVKFESIYKRSSNKTLELPDLKNPRIAVICPIYKADEVLLTRALLSMLNQTIQPNELLFIFDGWDDDKIKKLILFYFPDAKLISLSENRGQGSARNIGVKESNADLIAFVDQDDFWDPEHLGDLILGFSIGKFVFGYSDIAEVNEDGKVSISSMMHQAELLGNNKVIKSNIQDLLFKDLMIFPSSSMVRRDAFLEVGGFLENIRGHEDDFLFRKLIEKYEAHFYVNLRSSYWTNHSKGTSGSAAMSISRLQYAEILFKEFEKDDVLKRGIFIRLANSFVREITSLSKVSRFEDQEFSNINFYKLMRLAKIHDVAVPIRFRIFNLVKNYRMQKASIKIYKKVRSFATK